MISALHPIATPPAREALRMISMFNKPPLRILDQTMAVITLVDIDKYVFITALCYEDPISSAALNDGQ